MPPPDNTLSNLEQQSFAREVTDNTWNYKLDSELLGLLSCSTLRDNKTPMNTKVKHSYLRALPLHFHYALQKWR